MRTETPLTLVALLGRRDEPADGVEDYCRFLGQALAKRGAELKRVRLDWAREGRLGALRNLWRAGADWRDTWVLLQFTAMAWSRRGFPFLALAALWIVRQRGARCAVVFHEPRQQGSGSHWLDRVRGACQDWTIRRLYRKTTKAVFTTPIVKIGWLDRDGKAVSIPIGANIPERLHSIEGPDKADGANGAIAVFCVSAGANRFLEVADMTYAAKRVHDYTGASRLVVFGKGSAEVRDEIERSLAGSGVSLSVLGILSAEEVSETLSRAAALLFVSGYVSQNRGSALAGIACGLPIVGYSGGAAGTLIEEAGLELVPYRDQKALGAALVRVMSENALQGELRKKSCRAQETLFSWDVIARKYVEILGIGSID